MTTIRDGSNLGGTVRGGNGLSILILVTLLLFALAGVIWAMSMSALKRSGPDPCQTICTERFGPRAWSRWLSGDGRCLCTVPVPAPEEQ